MTNDTHEDGSGVRPGNPYHFNGLGMVLGSLSQLSHARTRSISAENFTGEKGGGAMATEGTGSNPARDLGKGWKVSPSISIAPQSTATLAHIQEAGAIQHIWISIIPAHWRNIILRAYWDDEESPSIECPFGDFFSNGWCELSLVNSLPISVNPAAGLNSYWEMPFRKSARLTLENLSQKAVGVY